jgi:hypothetical protein
MAYLGYQRLRLDWRGFYVNFARQHLTKLREVQAQTEVAVDRRLSLVPRSPVLAKVFQQAVPEPPLLAMEKDHREGSGSIEADAARRLDSICFPKASVCGSVRTPIARDDMGMQIEVLLLFGPTQNQVLSGKMKFAFEADGDFTVLPVIFDRFPRIGEGVGWGLELKSLRRVVRCVDGPENRR